MAEPTSRDFRLAILDRDDHTCQYCGQAITDAFCIDHVIPLCRGGQTLLHNLVTACPNCNRCKHTAVWVPRNLDEICAKRPEYAQQVRRLAGDGRQANWADLGRNSLRNQ